MAGEVILIVDDDPEISGMLSHMLEDERYHTVSAVSGQLALRMARAEKPDFNQALSLRRAYCPHQGASAAQQDACQQSVRSTNSPLSRAGD